MSLAVATGRPWLERGGRYESALAYDVDCAEAILGWRRELGVDDPIAPHFTLCFLGRGTHAQMRALWDALAGVALPAALDVALGGLGGFSRDGAIANVHLRVRADAALRALHAEVLAVGRRFAFFAPGPHVGDGWTPHVSISDAVALRALPVLTGVPATLRLADPHLIGQRLDAVRL